MSTGIQVSSCMSDGCLKIKACVEFRLWSLSITCWDQMGTQKGIWRVKYLVFVRVWDTWTWKETEEKWEKFLQMLFWVKNDCDTPVGVDQQGAEKDGEWHRGELRWSPIDLFSRSSLEKTWKQESFRQLHYYMSEKNKVIVSGEQYAAPLFCGIDENSFKFMKRDTGDSARETHVMPVQALKAQRN